MEKSVHVIEIEGKIALCTGQVGFRAIAYTVGKDEEYPDGDACQEISVDQERTGTTPKERKDF